jgi:molecular chaperone DnaK (HSP70)
MILSKLKQLKEFLAKNSYQSLITCPAYFGDAERTARIESGKLLP